MRISLIKKESARLFELVLNQVHLEGRNISCPFHEDRKPSFRVYAGERFKCFSCGKSGDVIDLASGLYRIPMKGKSFIELLKKLKGML